MPVGEKGAVPRQLGLDRATLVASGFDGKVGQTLVVPRRDGPSVVAVGVGDPATLDAAGLRDVAAAFARAAAKHGAPGHDAGRRRRASTPDVAGQASSRASSSPATATAR